MYFTYFKTTPRTFSSLITSLFALIIGMYAIAATFALVYTAIFYVGIKLWAIIGLLLLWAELFGTIMTFSTTVCDGPNSALLNLPLFAVDLTWVVICSNTIFTFIDYNSLFTGKEDPNKWKFTLSDILRLFAFIVVIIRYVGLAWTDHNFFLKRLVAPVRMDKVKEFSNQTFGQTQSF